MALEDMQSQYGPSNPKGQIGTGDSRDTFAFEGPKNVGHGGKNVRSKYGMETKRGQKPEAYGGTGERGMAKQPAERSKETF